MKKFLFAFLVIFLSVGESWAPSFGMWRCGSCTGTIALDDPSCVEVEGFCSESCYSCGSSTTTTSQSLAITGGTRYWDHICTTFNILLFCVSGMPTACDDGGGMV